jgi:hypothetical protein
VQARVDEAKAVTGAFLKQLGGTMKAEMKAGGPTAAMKVCRDVAPGIANDISLVAFCRIDKRKPRHKDGAKPAC